MIENIENIGSLEIVRYRFDLINKEPKIIIEMIKLLDKKGKYIKFVSLEKVIPYLSIFDVKFKAL